MLCLSCTGLGCFKEYGSASQVATMQDDDLEDEEDEYEESEDGFVVPNGYISEDEGLGSVQQSLNDLCADLEGMGTSSCLITCSLQPSVSDVMQSESDLPKRIGPAQRRPECTQNCRYIRHVCMALIVRPSLYR